MAVLVIPATALLAPALACQLPRLCVVRDHHSLTETLGVSGADIPSGVSRNSPTDLTSAEIAEQSVIARNSFGNRHLAETRDGLGAMLRDTLVETGEARRLLAVTRAALQQTLRSLVFVNTLYAATKISDSIAMSMMFDQVNDLLLRDDFCGCDDILRNVEVSKLPYNVMLGFLTFTFAARQHLQQRRDLYNRVMQRVATDRGPTAAQALLKTLR